MRRHILWTAMILFIACSLAATAQDKSPAKKPAATKAKTPPTVTVAPGLFEIKVKIDGHFESENTHPIRLEPKAWSRFTIVEAVPHGTRVKKGEVILRFDKRKLEEQIDELRRKLEASEIAMARLDVERQQAEERVALAREATEEAAKNTIRQWERYDRIGRDLAIESAKRRLQSAEFQLEYALEELKQLKKMYEADELTEETEEIVLKRTQREAERWKWYLKQTRIETEETLEFGIPQRSRNLMRAARLAELDLAKAAALREWEDREREMQWEEKERSHKKLEEELADHEHDLELMEIRAPIDGIVYFGSVDRGYPSDAASAARKLRPRATASVGSVLMTIVAPAPLRLRGQLAEADYHLVRIGQRARIVAKAFPFESLAGTVTEISRVPLKPGQFDIALRLDPRDGGPAIAVGMAAKATIEVYRVEEAITLPASSLHREGDTWYVKVETSPGKFVKRPVVVGRRTHDRFEITSGLKSGEKVKTTW